MPQRTPRTRTLLWAAALLLWLACFVPWQPMDVHGDAASYLGVARSLSDGAGFVEADGRRLVREPLAAVALTPAWLGVGWAWVPLLHLVLAAATVRLAVAWCRGPGRRRDAVWIGLWTATNPVFLHYLGRPLSEPLFAALLTGAAVAAQRPGGVGRIAAAALAAGAVGTRLAGLALTAGVMAAAARTRTPQSAATATVVTAACAATAAWVFWLQGTAGLTPADLSPAGTGRLMTDAAGPADHLWFSLHARIVGLGQATVPGLVSATVDASDWYDPNVPIFAAGAGLVFWGWFRLARSPRRATACDPWLLSLPAYLLIYLVWPFHQNGREWAPVAPVLGLCLLAGLSTLPGLPRPRLRVVFSVGIVAQAVAAAVHRAHTLNWI